MTPPDRFRASGFGAGTAAAPAVGDALQGALTLHSQGRFREALEILSGLGDMPTDAYVLRGDLQVELGQFTEAAGSYYTALVLAPANVYARSHLASCLRRLGRKLGNVPPLNLWVRTAPLGADQFCWRIDVMPRLAYLAGLELGAGVNLNVVAPEQVAAELREA